MTVTVPALEIASSSGGGAVGAIVGAIGGGTGGADEFALGAVSLLNRFAPIFVVAFLVSLIATPLVRRVALATGVVDLPDASRKRHAYPVAYLGGIAVFFGLLAAIILSYVLGDDGAGGFRAVPFAIIIGMVAITFTGFADDVWGWDPRLKIAGQLVAAAALAISDVGVHVAEGFFTPFLGGPDGVLLSVAGFHILNGHLFYWSGTAIIGIFVVGGCNSANLIDGLDGLLSGVTAIVAVGLLAICLLVASNTQRPETAAGTAHVAVAETNAVLEAYRAEFGSNPAALTELRADDGVHPTPELPLGWTLVYDREAGIVSARDDRAVVARGAVETVRAEVGGYRDRDPDRRFPRELSQLVRAGALAEIPAVPAGYRLRYDPNTGRVAAVLRPPSLASARVILCLALLGAVLGFLPHNFAPAAIFLGDCGSLLLGYMCIVTILMLGNQGQTHLVFAGLIVFALPIMDTTLAIIRRRLAGKSFSTADHEHIHHLLLRSLGGVKRAVLALYGISLVFAVVGVSLVALVLSGLRVRFIYAIALVLFSFIAVIAVKTARIKQLVEQSSNAVGGQEERHSGG